MRFCILGSSSAGNCALLQTPGSRVLIDAGFSGRKICQMLADIGMSLDEVDAIFITHDHSDHCKGLRGICRQKDVKVFATLDTSKAAQQMMPKSRISWQIFESGTKFSFQDLTVETFRVPHDAYETVGYLFTAGENEEADTGPRRSLVWMTDLGHITEQAASKATQAEILVIEANHDLQMLEQSDRPFHTKQRIRGRHGHLSNDATLAYIQEHNSKAKWKHIFLAHISNECNDPDLVRQLFGNELVQDSEDGPTSCPIHIVHPLTGCNTAVEIGPWKKVTKGVTNVWVTPSGTQNQAMLFE